MNANKEGRNLEEINKKILNFRGLSLAQRADGLKIEWNQTRIKCERCNEQIMAEWKNGEWSIGNWKAYLKKHDIGYYIVGGIKIYCSECDSRYNYLER